ncbi:MAG: helicase-exonuclease AddAB subunit AddA [Streptococcaceae bacterium]|jgi:ATP-dependent helicase/nuclease subunit A|nr:helicase-exonuclease AddAB subunit AddA [Streptococcaceae bacterium]
MIPIYNKEKTHFSKNQWQAIYDTGNNLLVCASAGSGKTSVLVERVIQKVMKGIGVQELLIVTFTDAAASEMKARIKAAIEQKLREDHLLEKVRRHFLKQLQELPLANISTFHTFCLTVIKRFFYLVKMDPNFSLQVDETKKQFLKEEVWNYFAERFLSKNNAEKFQELISTFSTDKSDHGLQEIVFKLYEFARVDPNPKAWLKSLIKFYEVTKSLDDAPIYQNYVKVHLLSQLKNSKLTYQAFLEKAKHTSSNKLVNITEKILQWVKEAQNFLANDCLDDWDASLDRLRISPYRFSKKEESYEEIMNLKPFWEHAKEKLNAIVVAENHLGSSSYHLEVLKKAKAIVLELVAITLAFYQEYQEQKEKKNFLDFSDLEHFALQILNKKNVDGCFEAQEYYQNKFSEILIDEYQDVNRLQVEIIARVSRNNNQFMVGDVKQSIYGFRLADPSLFMEKYDQFKQEKNGRLIILADNYRSRKEVLDFINLVFMQLMDVSIGQVAYEREAHLVASKLTFPESKVFHPEILLYERGDKTDASDNDEITASVEGEIHITAQKIRKLVDTSFKIWDEKKNIMRPIKFSDMVILTSTKAENSKIQEILTSYGINNHLTEANTYFQTTEIETMIALLKIIDNPYQDIPLVAVLRSPIVALKERDLAKIRLKDKQSSFYEALQKQVKSSFKIEQFMKCLTKWRDLAKNVSLADLLWDIYLESAYVDYIGAMPNGRQRQANLYALVDMAAQFEEDKLRGLFQFVRFIEKMHKKDKNLTEIMITTSENVVEIMTIHKSKGLEFPVVFVLNLSKNFNMSDLSKDVVLDEHLGIGIQLLDLTTRFKYETLPFLMIKHAKQVKLLSEEYRKLYVALTRAEQKLFLVGSIKDWERSVVKWESALLAKKVVLTKEIRMQTKNFMDLLMMALIHRKDAKAFGLNKDIKDNLQLKEHFAHFSITRINDAQIYAKRLKILVPEVEKLKLGTEKIQEYTEEIKTAKKRLDFHYLYEDSTKTAAYQSVSEIKRVFAEFDHEQFAKFKWKKEEKDNPFHHRFVSDHLIVPKFLRQLSKKKITQAEIGTAMHLLLQTVDLKVKPTKKIFLQLLKYFVKKDIIARHVAEKVDVMLLTDLFKTDFGEMLLNFKDQIYREEAFSLLLSPSKIYAGSFDTDDKVLIHGIVDGYIDFGEEILLFDYKTDNLSLNPSPKEIKVVKKRYLGQMNLYKLAIENALQKKVIGTKLVLLKAGVVIDVLY